MTKYERLNIATFEKVSFEEYSKSVLSKVPDSECTEEMLAKISNQYDAIKLPTRATWGSAGYDFYSPCEVRISEYSDALIHTGIRVKIEDGWMLALFPRSGLGFKYGLRLKNTTGIIDSDYYYAENEGHIMAKLAADEDVHIYAGDRFMQGVLIPYGVAKNDYVVEMNRIGGVGSTGV